MGAVPTITATTWPRQGTLLHCRVEVCFHGETTEFIPGTMVRDDIEAPFETIIQLDDGRVVRGVECQYAPLPTPPAAPQRRQSRRPRPTATRRPA